MGKFNWGFSTRPARASLIDGAQVLDRLEARLGTTVRGDARIILASQLDIAVTRMGQLQSLSAAAITAQRECTRIAAMLPRTFAAAIGPILVDELVRSRAGSPGNRHRV